MHYPSHRLLVNDAKIHDDETSDNASDAHKANDAHARHSIKVDVDDQAIEHGNHKQCIAKRPKPSKSPERRDARVLMYFRLKQD